MKDTLAYYLWEIIMTLKSLMSLAPKDETNDSYKQSVNIIKPQKIISPILQLEQAVTDNDLDGFKIFLLTDILYLNQPSLLEALALPHPFLLDHLVSEPKPR